jgi:hypothetical protein
MFHLELLLSALSATDVGSCQQLACTDDGGCSYMCATAVQPTAVIRQVHNDHMQSRLAAALRALQTVKCIRCTPFSDLRAHVRCALSALWSMSSLANTCQKNR